MDYFMSEEDANKNPILVTIEENSGDRYARATNQRGVCSNRDMGCPVKNMSAELNAWRDILAVGRS